MINPTGCCWTLGPCGVASVVGVVLAWSGAVTVGRVHEVLEKAFGDVLGLGQGRGQIRVVAEVSPPDRLRCT